MKPSPKQTYGNAGSSPSYTKGAMSKGALTQNVPLDNDQVPYGQVGKDGTVRGMQSLTTENLDDAGFSADGRHIVKHGTPYGEAAIFNYLPPGMDISNQTMALINQMPLKKVTEIQYPGDGGFPVRDIPE
jgi:hypothetical protein